MLEVSPLTGEEDDKLSDPRAAISFEGIGYDAETYAHDATIVYDNQVEGGSAQVGLAVSLETAAEVTLAGSGEGVLGKLIKVEQDGFCVVQTGGHVTLPGGDGATLTVGARIVGDLGAAAAEGYIQAAAAGTAADHAVSRGTIIDASDPTAVVVRLDTAN
jgi:hypothetical protein